VRRPISLLKPLQRIAEAQLGPVGGRERVEGEDVGLGIFEQGRDLAASGQDVSDFTGASKALAGLGLPIS